VLVRLALLACEIEGSLVVIALGTTTDEACDAGTARDTARGITIDSDCETMIDGECEAPAPRTEEEPCEPERMMRTSFLSVIWRSAAKR
jgi:hypothetical protein